MMKNRFLLLLSFVLLVGINAFSEVRLPHTLSSHMVLQRDQPIKIWGWADVGEKVKVTFNHKSKRITADKHGSWMLVFPAMGAGGPYEITVEASNAIRLKDVLIGDVWVCSGQSNMEWSLRKFPDCKKAITNANNPNMRFLDVPRKMASSPQADILTSNWMEVSPQSIADFSAVAYFFGEELQSHLGVPLGLIGSNWGGTKIEAWMSKDALMKFKEVEVREIVDAKHPNKYNTSLFNGMISPLLRCAVRGVIWYQGESNARSNPREYHSLFTAMISDWREKWNMPEMPFLYVQLANYMKKDEDAPMQSDWALLRESQAKTLATPNTGMAVIIDLGEGKNIHPGQKNKVGERLFQVARKVAYGEDVVASGPRFKAMQVMGSSVQISFNTIGSGLMSKNKYGYLQGFQVAGADKTFHWATALFDQDKVVVFSPRVNKPVAVRYAWGDNPEADLYNKEGFPAIPFRTDDW